MVFVIKYRKKVITEEIEESIKNICIKISERYEIKFLEVGLDEDHIHLLIQSIPKLSVSIIVRPSLILCQYIDTELRTVSDILFFTSQAHL